MDKHYVASLVDCPWMRPHILFQKEAGYNIKFPDPIGQLVHEPTMSRISVYKPIPRFKRLMLRWALGLKFEKI